MKKKFLVLKFNKNTPTNSQLLLLQRKFWKFFYSCIPLRNKRTGKKKRKKKGMILKENSKLVLCNPPQPQAPKKIEFKIKIINIKIIKFKKNPN